MSVDKLLEGMPELPAMPAIVAQVMQVTQNPAAELADIAEVLERDPALSAKVLRVSNSPYFGMKRQIGTIRLAVVVLGLREIRDIALGIALFEAVHSESTDKRAALEIWNHALRVGGAARRVGAIMEPGFQDGAFIAGLLSDIGRMLLLTYWGRRYSEVYTRCRTGWRELITTENDTFRCNHAEVAGALGRMWNLPHGLVDALQMQYPFQGRSLWDCADPELAALIRVAKSTLDDSFAADEETEDEQITVLDDTEVWNVLAHVKYPLAVESRREVLCGVGDEIRNLPYVSF